VRSAKIKEGGVRKDMKQSETANVGIAEEVKGDGRVGGRGRTEGRERGRDRNLGRCGHSRGLKPVGQWGKDHSGRRNNRQDGRDGAWA